MIRDLKASVSVFLVALPLCLGLAVASGTDPLSGLVAGIIGGIVVGFLSDSPLSVSGPAAGLTVVVVQSIAAMGGFPQFLSALILAGALQIVMGALRVGFVGNFFPGSVIQGLLSAIGLMLIFKQLPHAVGYDHTHEGNATFLQPDGSNTFSEIVHAMGAVEPHAILIFALCLCSLILWGSSLAWGQRVFKAVPGPLAATVVGLLGHVVLRKFWPQAALAPEHLVQLPAAGELLGALRFPDLSVLAEWRTIKVGATIAVVASLETLLNIDASDKLDPQKRITSRNRELVAQGVGNMANGFLGGLPVTSVVVRTTINTSSGARSKKSTMFHGAWLVLSVFLTAWINLIPLSALAAILIIAGYKLARPAVFREMWARGANQFAPFVVTIASILLTDLLTGTLIGIVVGVVCVIRANFQAAILMVNDGSNYLLKMQKDITFLNKSRLRGMLAGIPDNAYVILDASKAIYVDQDVIDTVDDFLERARFRGITVEIKRPSKALSHFLQEEKAS